MLYLAAGLCLLSALNTHAQLQRDYTTPVPILKQIDKHNEDGSYTYGFEAADKSFKIETKYPNGEVYGKYGFVDDQGKVREIEYGASQRGFEPVGSDINVPPPTLVNNHNAYPLGPNEVDDGQYREDPSVYYKNENFNRPVAASKFSLNNYHTQPAYNKPAPAPQYNPAPNYYNAPALSIAPRYQAPPQQQQQHQPQPQPYYQQHYNAPRNDYNNKGYNLHPAVKNLDIWSGSYSIDYTGRK